MSRVKFGDVVKDCKEKINRNNNPYEFYVAGDHMDTEDLVIRRKGRFATDDVGPAFIRLFRPGQILYGSRRTYLKKVAVADFEGVTANTTFVFETKDESVLRQRLLPFIMLSDSFTEWSIKRSKGSTNPYVLFSDLADFEFDLPDVKQQDEYVELLWSIWDAKEAYRKLLAATDELVKARFVEMFGNYGNEKTRLSNVCLKGPQNGFYRKDANVNGTVPIIKMKELFGYDSMDKAVDCELVLLSENELNRFKLTHNDLLFGRRSLVLEGAGKCRRVGNLEKDTVFESSLLRISVDSQRVRPRFLQSWFETSDGRKEIEGIRSVTTIAGIKGSDLANVMVPNVPIHLQDELLAYLEVIDNIKSGAGRTIEAVNSMLKSYLETITT